MDAFRYNTRRDTHSCILLRRKIGETKKNKKTNKFEKKVVNWIFVEHIENACDSGIDPNDATIETLLLSISSIVPLFESIGAHAKNKNKKGMRASMPHHDTSFYIFADVVYIAHGTHTHTACSTLAQRQTDVWRI